MCKDTLAERPLPLGFVASPGRPSPFSKQKLSRRFYLHLKRVGTKYEVPDLFASGEFDPKNQTQRVFPNEPV